MDIKGATCTFGKGAVCCFEDARGVAFAQGSALGFIMMSQVPANMPLCPPAGTAIGASSGKKPSSFSPSAKNPFKEPTTDSQESRLASYESLPTPPAKAAKIQSYIFDYESSDESSNECEESIRIFKVAAPGSEPPTPEPTKTPLLVSSPASKHASRLPADSRSNTYTELDELLYPEGFDPHCIDGGNVMDLDSYQSIPSDLLTSGDILIPADASHPSEVTSAVPAAAPPPSEVTSVNPSSPDTSDPSFQRALDTLFNRAPPS